jgi:hypothetical protein
MNAGVSTARSRRASRSEDFDDNQLRQALHDRYFGTIIVSSRRGYSLDIKIKRLLETVRQNVRR